MYPVRLGRRSETFCGEGDSDVMLPACRRFFGGRSFCFATLRRVTRDAKRDDELGEAFKRFFKSSRCTGRRLVTRLSSTMTNESLNVTMLPRGRGTRCLGD